MKRYKLLKDLPTIKAGEIFKETVTGYNEKNLLVRIAPLNAKSPRLKVQDIDNFDEWFEEIQEEPIDSIHWIPKDGEEYWYIGDDGPIRSIRFSSYDGDDANRLAIGNVYLTKAEAICVRERKIAEVKLRRTSNFKPDFENGNGGWIVYYSYKTKGLFTYRTSSNNAGEPVHYRTEEEAEKSIKENEKDWLAYFNVEDC